MSRPIRERLGERLRWLRTLPQARALILVYHRVAELPSDPWGLAVTPADFDDHLEVIRRGWHPLSLDALNDAIAADRVPHGAVVVTFDDGYADNLHAAKPRLERQGVPATMFLASGAIGNPRVFWWDELDRLILGPGSLPPTLELRIAGEPVRAKLSDDVGTAGDAHAPDRMWRAWDPPVSPRQALYYRLWDRLRRVSSEQRDRVLDDLAAWAGRSDAPASIDRPLESAEVERLANGGLITVGAHTILHPRLSEVSAERQRAEIEGSKSTLEALLNRPVDTFAYPFGGTDDFTARSVEIVRQAGFRCACTVTADTVRRGVDVYRLPRFYVTGWSGEALERVLRHWLGRPRRPTAGEGAVSRLPAVAPSAHHSPEPLPDGH